MMLDWTVMDSETLTVSFIRASPPDPLTLKQKSVALLLVLNRDFGRCLTCVGK